MEYVCVDVETTGLDPANDEIVEVCALKFDEIGQKIDEFYKLCSPLGGSIPSAASAIHGITMSKVAGLAPYPNIRQELADFIGKSTVVGHNIIDFDLHFLKLKPAKVEDTLLICRSIWPSGNRLALACKRVGIKFDDKEAHTAQYDVLKTMELYLTLKAMQSAPPQATLFDKPALASTQIYSYSRINLFHQCPYKWKRVYLLNDKEPDHSYFVIGKTLHKIAQISAIWCYAKTFANKFRIYMKDKRDIPTGLFNVIKDCMKNELLYLPQKIENLSMSHIGMFLYRNPRYCEQFYEKTIIEMINDMEKKVPEGTYEIVDRPDADKYLEIVQRAMAQEHCSDPDSINEVSWISDFFYKQKNFSMMAGQVALVEKQFVFNRNWEKLNGWWDKTAYMRGVLDIIEYDGYNHVTITDYKSSRKMLTEKQLSSDTQMKIYVLFIHKYLPEVSSITIRHHYMRFGKVIQCVINNVAQVAKEAEIWVDESIHEIEVEMLKPECESFKPRRNEHCGTCYKALNNQCPLFNVKNINDIDDPANFVVKSMDDVRKAWKKVEVNKMEIKNLTNKVKQFVLECKGKVSIDQTATLDYWVKEELEYDPVSATKLLLSKKDDILPTILRNCSLSRTAMEKVLKIAKLELTAEELAMISSKKVETKFDAFTQEQAEEAGFINRGVPREAPLLDK